MQLGQIISKRAKTHLDIYALWCIHHLMAPTGALYANIDYELIQRLHKAARKRKGGRGNGRTKREILESALRRELAHDGARSAESSTVEDLW